MASLVRLKGRRARTAALPLDRLSQGRLPSQVPKILESVI